jgi:hypothetical protein
MDMIASAANLGLIGGVDGAVVGNKRRMGCNVTPEELESLAIYRNHKKCQCVHCQEARRVLSEYDSQPRFCKSETSQNTVTPALS